MDPSNHADLSISDSENILDESVVESEILRSSILSISIGDGKSSADSNIKQDLNLAEIKLFEDELMPTNVEIQEIQEIDLMSDSVVCSIVNENKIVDSNTESAKRKKKRSPKKLSIRAKPLKILPHPAPLFNTEELSRNKLFEIIKLDNVDEDFSDDKMLMRTAEERKIRSPIVIHNPVMKRCSLSLQDKVSIIKELENGEKQANICKRKRLPKSTVQSIWKNREKIQGAIVKVGQTRKRCRRAQHEDIEDKLVDWIESLKSQNVPVNGPQLRAKAQVLAKCMGLSEFRCSTGWLDKFKTRHNIVFKKSVKSPKNGAAGDRKTALDWVTKIWPSYCEGYSPEDIFNADEVGLFYKATPEETAKLSPENCHGGTMAKERITTLLCTNSIGTEKLKPVVVGCQPNPKSFTWISKLDNLPVEYIYNSKSWMTRDIFVSWLRRWDRSLKQKGRNILLILDNSPAHFVNVTLTNIKLACLPPIVASILQPLEHGVLKFFKTRYRHLFLDRLVRKYEQRDVMSSLSTTLLESVSMVHAAWEEVKPQLITNCFKNSNLQSLSVATNTPIFSPPPNNFDEYKNDPLLIEQAVRSGISIPENVSLEEYAMIDSNLHVTDYCNKDNNNDTMTNGNNNIKIKELVDDDDSEDDSLQNIVIPARRDVQSFIDAIRNWAMISNDSCDYSVHTALSILESFASQQCNSLATIPFTTTNGTNILGGAQSTFANLNLNILNGIPISIQSNSSGGAGSGGSNRNHFNGSQTLFYTPNIGTSHIIQGQTASGVPGSVVTLTIDPSPQRNLTHAHSGNISVTTQGQSQNNSNSTTTQPNIHSQPQQQFFAYLG